MPIQSLTAVWKGNIVKGNGSIRLGSDSFEGNFTRGSRFDNDKGTSPEELIAAAHADCFSMAISSMISISPNWY